jgi:urease accessory protein
MTTSAVLTLAQWLSPAYPLGSFAYSHGLEAAIEAGWVNDAASLQSWLEDVLTDGSGRADAILLCAAFRAEDVSEIDATARAFAASRERLRESLQQGRAFAQTTTSVWDVEVPDLMFPVAVGHAAAKLGAPMELAAAMYLQAFVSNITMACVRLLPLGQTAGQRIIRNLTPLCETTAQAASTATLDDLYSNTFLSDIAAMRHEVQQPRLFQS